jgi:hypothetical protein
MTSIDYGAGVAESAASSFAPDYVAARRLFLDETTRRGALARCYVNPNKGPNGEELATDTAWLGDAEASDVLVLVSATHGVEGFCGSGCQVDLLRTGWLDYLPKGTAVLLVHAMNPYGFAWLRRVTEENVDLNRNFVDFADPPPNPDYAEIAADLFPERDDPESLAAAAERLAAWRARHGDKAYRFAYSSGQYVDAKGIFYGGRAPTWSRRTAETLIADWRLGERRFVAAIDYHTGLGPYGYGEPIAGYPPESLAVRRLQRWIGPSLTDPHRNASVSPVRLGSSRSGWGRLIGESLAHVTLEYGTYPYEGSMSVVMAEQRLYRRGLVDWNDPEMRAAKVALRRYFHPDLQDWREMVLFRSRQVVRQFFDSLPGPSA